MSKRVLLIIIITVSLALALVFIYLGTLNYCYGGACGLDANHTSSLGHRLSHLAKYKTYFLVASAVSGFVALVCIVLFFVKRKSKS